jgi:predicted aspartyl protease
MKLNICVLWTALVLPAPCLSQIFPDAIPTSDRKLPAVVAPVEIPFKLYQDYLIVVQGSLGTLDRLNFLIDTGTNPSMIDRRIAKKLRLRGKAGKLALFKQDSKVERVVLPSIRLGPVRADFLPGFVHDLSPVGKALGVRIDAIVGLDLLGRSSFVIDYTSKKISFGAIEPSPYEVPFDTGPPTLTLQLRIHDQGVRLLVDTGAANLLLFDCQLPADLLELPTRGIKRSSNAEGTEFEVKEIWIPEVRLGTTDFGLEKAFLVNDKANCGLAFDGVVGAASLGLKWIAFDFERRSFSWKR